MQDDEDSAGDALEAVREMVDDLDHEEAREGAPVSR